MGNVPQMHVEDLKQRLDAKDDVVVLDVRDQDEYNRANIGGTPIPLNDLPKRLGELDPSKETVVHCRGGGRSTKAVEYLQTQGFKNVKNLAGGILAWAEKIDPNLKGKI